MDAYEKEEALQMHVLDRALAKCPKDDAGKLQELAERIAQTAYEVFCRVRFGSFYGGDKCAVYVNMDPTNLWVLDGLRQKMEEAGVQELAAATWPKEGTDKDYSFAIIIDSHKYPVWCEVARSVWQAGMRRRIEKGR